MVDTDDPYIFTYFCLNDESHRDYVHLQNKLNGPNPEEQPRVTVARSVLKVTRAFLLWSELWWGEEASPHLPVPIALS